MRWLFCSLLLALIGFVNGLSSSGNRVLVVIEEAAERENYSTFLGDLEGEQSAYIREQPDTMSQIVCSCNLHRTGLQAFV